MDDKNKMSTKEYGFFIKGEMNVVGKVMNFLDNYVKNEVNTKTDDPHETGKLEACLKISKAVSVLLDDLQLEQLCNNHDQMLEEGLIDY